MKIFENPREASDIIRIITAGPGMDQELTRTALSMLLAHMGCGYIDVRISEIPYRTKWE
jgi:hypothetical protein